MGFECDSQVAGKNEFYPLSAVGFYEEGTGLIKLCSKMLDQAEQKVVKLKKGPDRAPIELEFEEEE